MLADIIGLEKKLLRKLQTFDAFNSGGLDCINCPGNVFGDTVLSSGGVML